MRTYLLFRWVYLATVLMASTAFAEKNLVPDPDFRRTAERIQNSTGHKEGKSQQRTAWQFNVMEPDAGASYSDGRAELYGGKGFLNSGVFAVKPGRRYRLSLTVEGNGKISAGVLWWETQEKNRDRKEKPLKTTMEDPVVPGEKEPERISAVFRAPQQAKKARVRLRVNDGRILVRDVMVTTRPGNDKQRELPEDQRPPFDKSDHLGTVWTHVNSWKTETFAQEPLKVDHALPNSMGNPVQDYARTAQVLEKYGINGIYLQAAREQFSLRNALTGFQKAGNGRKVAYFMANATFFPDARGINRIDDPDEKADRIIETVAGWLNKNRRWFLEHPNFHRVDGHPVMVLYGFGGLNMTPELWERVLPEIEKQAYRCIWLFHNHFWRDGTLKTWMPVMDGVTQYASGHHYRNMTRIAEPMKRNWPGKIFEANASPLHQSVVQGQTGYDLGLHTYKWRNAIDVALNLDPDSLHLTNWNDIEENSHIWPSYLRRNTFLRIFDAMSRTWRGRPEYGAGFPELILSQKIDVLLGEPVDVEVVVLPMAPDRPSEIELELSIVSAEGETLQHFARTVDAGELSAERFRAASIPFSDEPVVYPSITYRWNNREFGPFRLRPTRLWVGQKPTDLVWMTPLEEWRKDLAVNWKIRRPGEDASQAAKPGDNIVTDAPNGTPWHVIRTLTNAEKGKDTTYRLMRNGKPVKDMPARQSAFRTNKTSVVYHHADRAPWSWLEIEAQLFDVETVPFGNRKPRMRQPEGVWNSRAIFVHRGGHWQEPVDVPVAVRSFDSSEEQMARKNTPLYLRHVPYEDVTTVRVPRYRVPFWYYPIDADEGELFRDQSGYRHHGWLGTHNRNAHTDFGPFGFRFSHLFPDANAPIAGSKQLNKHAPDFQRGDNGTGFLRFDGKRTYVMLPPRTRMPLAGTHELRVRGEATGQRQTIIGTFSSGYFDGMGQTHPFRLNLDPRGRPEFVLFPGKDNTRRIRADQPIPPDKWTHLAVVYDLEEWRLYVDGEPVGEGLDVPPRGELQVNTSLLLGMMPQAGITPDQLSKSRFRRQPFAGDIAEFRATGRPLAPEDFLPDGP